jgi:hypothetical protein
LHNSNGVSREQSRWLWGQSGEHLPLVHIRVSLTSHLQWNNNSNNDHTRSLFEEQNDEQQDQLHASLGALKEVN